MLHERETLQIATSVMMVVDRRRCCRTSSLLRSRADLSAVASYRRPRQVSSAQSVWQLRCCDQWSADRRRRDRRNASYDTRVEILPEGRRRSSAWPRRCCCRFTGLDTMVADHLLVGRTQPHVRIASMVHAAHADALVQQPISRENESSAGSWRLRRGWQDRALARFKEQTGGELHTRGSAIVADHC